jgi:O-acetyl-ADP-ribose deacetylase (regulator of RNase III)
MNQRTYSIGNSQFVLEFGDLTKSTASVLVSSDDYLLTMGGGVSFAIRKAAGETIILDAAKKTPARVGDVVVTSGGALPAKHIFHAITIGRGMQEVDVKQIIRVTTQRSLDLLELLNLDSIAFPAIGAGAAGFNYEDVAVVMADVITKHLFSSPRALHVTIYLYDPFRRNQIDFVRFFEEIAVKVSALRDSELVEEGKSKQLPEEKKLPIEDKKAVERQGVIQKLGSLAQERDRIERELAEYSEGLDSKSIRDLQNRLSEIHKERLDILAKLRPTAKEGIPVFISYAHEDENLRVALGKHLSVLEREGLVTTWHDRMIRPGKEWKGEIDSSLDNAGVIILLVSSDFINSDYCYDIELKRALEHHENRKAIVVPVILRPVLWHKTLFAKLQALPKDGKPVTEFLNQDSAFVEITEGVRSAIESYLSERT